MVLLARLEHLRPWLLGLLLLLLVSVTFPLLLLALPVIAVVAIALVLFLPWLAQESVLFTTVKEGTAKAIMRGDSFDRFVMSFEGYHLNVPSEPGYDSSEPDWQVLYHGRNNTSGFGEGAAKGTPSADGLPDSFFDRRLWLLKTLGLYWVGWPWATSVYVYQFEWNETKTGATGTDAAGKEQVLPRAEATDFIYVSDFTYAFVTDGAETRDRLPTDELTLATTAVRNPYRALFSGQDWMQRVTGAINRNVRYFVGSYDYQDLIGPQDKAAGSDEAEEDRKKRWTEFSKPIIDLSERLPDDVDGRLPHGLRGHYGVEIRTVDLQTIELSGDGKIDNQKAAVRLYTAQQEALATRATGDAEAYVILAKGQKEAESLKIRLLTIEEHGETGKLLAQLDAMGTVDPKDGKRTIIWANNPFIGALGAIIPPTPPSGEDKS